MGYTTDDLIDSLKKRGLIPTSQNTFQTADFVRFMDEELRLEIVPQIMTVRENFFLESTDVTLVANTSSYEIPTRAIGAKVKDVYFLDAGGNTKKLWQADTDDIIQFSATSTQPEPEAYYFKDNFYVLLPSVSSAVSGSLRVYYFQRRNSLVDETQAGQITAINSNVLTVNNAPTTFTTSVSYDLVKGTPGFQNRGIDRAVSNVAGSALTFSATVPTDLVVGDWVCLAGESVIPQVPYEIFPILSQRTMIRCLRALNDIAGSEKAKEDLKSMEEKGLRLISQRAEEQSKRVASMQGLSSYLWS